MPDFITLAEAKLQLNIPSAATTYDVELATYISAACLTVDKLAGAVAPRAVTEVVPRRVGCYSVMVATRPVMSVTSMTALDGSGTYDVTALYVASPKAGLVRRADGRAVVGGPWTVVYQAGRAAVPENINLAGRMLVQHLWETQRGGPPTAPRMDAGVEGGTPGIWFAVPNKVKELLEGESAPMVAF